MSTKKSEKSSSRRRLRLWPGVVIAILQLLMTFVVPVIFPEAMIVGVMGGALGGLGILIWWLFFSRAPWLDRLGAIGVMVVALIGTSFLIHESIAGGAMGMLFYFLAVPYLGLAFVAWAVVSRVMPLGLRRPTMVITILLACGVWLLVRTGGFSGEFEHDFAWRWSQTPEEKLLAKSGKEKAPMLVVDSAVVIQAEWPGFRGPARDGVIRGLQIETDWSASPPVELWRRPVGPGWSSFAVSGDVFFTQEQRGEEEVVAGYYLSTGKPLWKHQDAARFWESNAGAGPRGTPTLSNGRLYTFGATGIVNALNAVDGSGVWSRNAASDTDTEIPGWAFSSSPLVVDDLVIIAVEGELVAFDITNGEPRWFGPDGGYGYSSPHLVTIDSVRQILLMRGSKVTSFAPADGKILWEHPLPSGTSIVQPAMTEDGDLLLSDGETTGIRRIKVSNGPDGWTVEERWASNRLKPYFSDFTVHGSYAYGFDGNILACINIEDGKRQWKGGRYGSGQMLLLADQDLLLVLSEKGELALVNATPDQFTEVARFPAIEGKTWNHPVLVGDVLLVRNAQEMAAFRLSLKGS